jgi:hypothetical protein
MRKAGCQKGEVIMDDWERGIQAVRYNRHVAWEVTINAHGIKSLKAGLSPQMHNQLHSFLENDRPEIRWAYDEASCDAYLIKHLTGDLYSWWIWSEIQDTEEFKRLIEAHEELRGQPLNEQRANDMYTTATNRPP